MLFCDILDFDGSALTRRILFLGQHGNGAAADGPDPLYLQQAAACICELKLA